jgi:hypothetical protein
VTRRRITRVLGLLVVLIGLAIAPATGAGAHDRDRAPAPHHTQASAVRRIDDTLTSTVPRTATTCGVAGRRAHLGHVPLVAHLVPGGRAAGEHPGDRVATEPGGALHESSALGRCGRGPPAA